MSVAVGRGLARRLTAGGRLLVLAISVVGTAWAPARGEPLALCGAAAALSALLVRPPLGRTLWRALVLMALLASMLWPLWLADDPSQARYVAFRAAVAGMLALIWGSALRLDEVAAGLRTVGLPDVLCSAIAAVTRQLGALRDEARRLSLARQLRGARGLSLSTQALAMLLLKSARRAEQVELSMALRGHGLGVPRTSLSRVDLVVALLAAGLFASLRALSLGQWA